MSNFSAKYRCGRKLPGRLAIVVDISGKPINLLCKLHNARSINNIGSDNNYRLTLYQPDFVKVIQGKKNLRKHIQILEQAWKLPIHEIRQYYAEDKNRTLSKEEIFEFTNYYIAKRKGISIEEKLMQDKELWNRVFRSME